MSLKQFMQGIIFPVGSIQKIRRGYLKGLRFRLTENSGWSPIIGNWEPAMQRIMTNLVKEGDVVYDIGANNGLHGMLLAGLVGKSGKVYNFEPLPGNIEEINENFRFNGIVNYENIIAAVFSENGKQIFELGQHAKQGSISDGRSFSVHTIEVDVIALDSFIESGYPGPSFIKMDIEGAEGPALKGFEKSIEVYRPIMVIELHNPEQDLEVGTFLFEHRYAAYRFDPFKTLKFTKVGSLNKPFPDPNGIWGSILCLPLERQIDEFSFDK